LVLFFGIVKENKADNSFFYTINNKQQRGEQHRELKGLEGSFFF